MHRVLDSRLLRIVEDRLYLVVVRLICLVEILCRVLRPILLVRVNVARTVQRDDIHAAADIDPAVERRPFLIVRRRRVHTLTRVPLRRGIRNVVTRGIKRELIVLDPPHHRIESGKC